MSRNKRVKIFLKKDNSYLELMWADVTRDGSVMMGLSGDTFKAQVEKIFLRKAN